jgi:hypothetical protein
MRRSLCALAVVGSVWAAAAASATPAVADPVTQAEWDACSWGPTWAAGGALLACDAVGDPFSDCAMTAGDVYSAAKVTCLGN